MTRLGLLLVLIAATGLPLTSQELRFDVASIKARPTDDTTQFRVSFEPGGHFVTVNAPVTFWIAQVYPNPSGRLEGAPAWLSRQGFDISAKAEGNPSPGQLLEMLRGLLRDRFKFASHYEEREENSFALVHNHPQRVLGPQLRRTDVDCDARAAAEKAGNPPPPLPNAPNGIPVCRIRSTSGSVISGGMTVSALANALAFGARRIAGVRPAPLAVAEHWVRGWPSRWRRSRSAIGEAADQAFRHSAPSRARRSGSLGLAGITIDELRAWRWLPFHIGRQR